MLPICRAVYPHFAAAPYRAAPRTTITHPAMDESPKVGHIVAQLDGDLVRLDGYTDPGEKGNRLCVGHWSWGCLPPCS